jgi:hypothetical protein
MKRRPPMPRTCSICSHAEREAIDEALVGGSSNLSVSSLFDVSEAAVRRHKSNHLPAKLVLAHEAEEVATADNLLEKVQDLQSRTMAILDQAEGAGDLRTALGAIREARGNVELLAKLLGELDERPVVNVMLIDPKVRDAIVRALTPYGEARLAVASALKPFEEAS